MKKVLTQRYGATEYLHKDFHGAMSNAIEYLRKVYGVSAVKEYLYNTAKTLYPNVTRDIKKYGLTALVKHFTKMYSTEKVCNIKIRINKDVGKLVVITPFCPAVTHMRKNGYRVSPLWKLTEVVVNSAIVDGTGYSYKLLKYNKRTGASTQVFYKKGGTP
ncbi:MAG: hypothetical protein WC955_06920 [Elusimicrobiota bacterium]